MSTKSARSQRMSMAVILLAMTAAASVHAADLSAGAATPGIPAESRQAISPGTIIVRVVSSADCFNTPPTMELIESTARELNLNVDVTRHIATTLQDADQYRFFGSPTVQIDGLDLEEEMRKSTRYVLT